MHESATVGPERRRLTLAVVVVLCLLPLAGAWLLTTQFPGWRPFGSASHGTLVQPPRSLTPEGLVGPDGEALGAGYFHHKWTLMLVTEMPCTQPCRDALYGTRQARRALGQDMNRVQRLWVISGESWPSGFGDVRAQHPELGVARASADWVRALPAASGSFTPSRIYLIDPEARLMMAYAGDAAAKGILEDLRRLLRASRIG